MKGLFMKKLFVSILCLNGFLFGDISEPYRSINDLPFDGQGWFSNAEQMENLIAAKSPRTVIEVGSWLGTSTRFIASRLQQSGGLLYAVDTWKGSPNESIHLQDPRLPFLFQLFLSNVKHAGLTEVIIPVRMNSLEAAAALNVKADLIYIDASHDAPSVIEDILHWYPHLTLNGVMCGDDWNWQGVQEAVIHCASLLNVKVNASGNFWYYERN